MLPLPSATMVSAAGYMLETPSIRPVLALKRSNNSAVRTISRKDPDMFGNPQRPYASHLSIEMKIWSEPCGDVGRSAEMLVRLSNHVHSI